MIVEYRTQPIEPTVLLDELSSFCNVIASKGTNAAILMFGWGSNLPNDEMWWAPDFKPTVVNTIKAETAILLDLMAPKG